MFHKLLHKLGGADIQHTDVHPVPVWVWLSTSSSDHHVQLLKYHQDYEEGNGLSGSNTYLCYQYYCVIDLGILTQILTAIQHYAFSLGYDTIYKSKKRNDSLEINFLQ